MNELQYEESNQVQAVVKPANGEHSEVRPIILDGFFQFGRNGKWGTCGSCPRIESKAYPELCEFKERYDHKLTLTSLVDQYNRG